MASPEVALATLISDNVAGYTYGTNVFTGRVQATPIAAIFVIPIGGPAPQSLIGSESDYRKDFQIRLRGERNGYATLKSLARTVHALVYKADLSTVTGFYNCLVSQSDPVDIGYNKDMFPEMNVNVEVYIKE